MWQLTDPNISNIHLELILSEQWEVILLNWDGGIRTAVDVVASLGVIVLSFVLLDSFGPAQ